MKRKIFIIIFILIGLGAITYPTISNYLIEKNGTAAIDAYDEALAKQNAEEIAKAWEEAKTYNENLIGQPAHDPFIPGSGIVMPDNYYEVLNIKGIMGYVEIPKIGVNLPIYHGTSEEVLNKAVGHLEGSTLPIGGAGTHSVITGHSGLMHAKIFTDLADLKEGNHFYLHVLGEVLAYKIDQIKVIEPEHTEDLKTEKGRDLSTLLTCTPYGVNSHRLLVRGKRVPYEPSKKEKKKTGLTKEQLAIIRAAIITSAVMLILIVLTLLHRRKKTGSKEKS